MSRYSPEAVRDRAFAFDGAVISVETRVDPKLSTELPWITFKVNRWFKGGQSAEVAIWVPLDASPGAWPLEPGDRLLAAGEYRWGQPPEDPLAWGCGFTQPYTLEAAAGWAGAMSATTAMAGVQTSTPVTERPPFVFPKPPLADLTIGGQNQTAGLAGFCWSDETGRPSCQTMIGIPTPQEPLRTNSPFTADFGLRAEGSPSELSLDIYPVEADDQLDTKNGGMRWWRLSGTLWNQFVLPPERESSADLSLEDGLYVFVVFGRWPWMGTASYGFLVEVR